MKEEEMEESSEGRQYGHSNLLDSTQMNPGIKHVIEINRVLPFGGGSALKFNPNKSSPTTTL